MVGFQFLNIRRKDERLTQGYRFQPPLERLEMLEPVLVGDERFVHPNPFQLGKRRQNFERLVGDPRRTHWAETGFFDVGMVGQRRDARVSHFAVSDLNDAERWNLRQRSHPVVIERVADFDLFKLRSLQRSDAGAILQLMIDAAFGLGNIVVDANHSQLGQCSDPAKRLVAQQRTVAHDVRGASILITTNR